MSSIVAEAAPSAFELENGVQAAIGFTDYENGVSVIRCATVAPFAPEMPDMVFDCSVEVTDSRVAVAGIMNAKLFNGSKIARAGINIRIEGVQAHIDKLADALDAVPRTNDKARCLQAARFSLKTLYAGHLFGKFSMGEDRYEDQMPDVLRAYRERMFDNVELHPALKLASAHLTRHRALKVV